MAEDQDPDRELVETARNGPDREQAFLKLYQRYIRALDDFFRHKGYSPQEREDLIQETFLRAFKGLEVIQVEIPFRPWLFLMARHVHRDEIRRRKAKPRNGVTISLDAPLAPNTLPAPEKPGEPLENALHKEQQERVHRACLELPPKMRHALLMYLRGDRIREIALAMRITPGAVKAHLHQARQRLREKLELYFDEPGFWKGEVSRDNEEEPDGR